MGSVVVCAGGCVWGLFCVSSLGGGLCMGGGGVVFFFFFFVKKIFVTFVSIFNSSYSLEVIVCFSDRFFNRFF